MATRKQRRRQQKLRRHEWEEVWVDEEGHELDADAAELAKPKADSSRNGVARATKAQAKPRDAKGRPLRAIQPPSWQRVLKRAGIFFPLMFVVITLTNKHASPAGKVLVALAYAILLIPFMYLMDRTTYRAYLRRTGRTPDDSRTRKR
jgi:hypothetical protein